MIIIVNKYKILTLVVAMTLMLPVALQGAQAIEVGMLIEGFGSEQQVTKEQIDEPEKEEKAAEKQAKIAEKAEEKAKEKGQSLGICDFDPAPDGVVTAAEAAFQYSLVYGIPTQFLIDGFQSTMINQIGVTSLTTFDQVLQFDNEIGLKTENEPNDIAVCSSTQ